MDVKTTKKEPITDDRLFWAGNRFPFYSTAVSKSLEVYRHAMFRKHIVNTLEAQNFEDVVIFGGLVRREIRSSMILDKVFEDSDVDVISEAFFSDKRDKEFSMPVHVPANCFVSHTADVDIYFSDLATILSFVKTLEKWYDIEARIQENSQYTGCTIFHVVVREKVRLMETTVIHLDLVTRISPDIVFLPDFNVNTLQLSKCQISKFSQLYKPANVKSSSTFREAMLCHRELNGIMEDIGNFSTSMIVFSLSYFRRFFTDHVNALNKLSKDDEEEEEEEEDEGDEFASYPTIYMKESKFLHFYTMYIARLFHHRLHKMLNIGWKVTNLELNASPSGVTMTCGHTWRYVYDELRYSCEEAVVIRCNECCLTETLFDKFY
jgi:hypothetical protein